VEEPKGEPIVYLGTLPTPEDPFPSNQIIKEYSDETVMIVTPPPTEKEIEEYRKAVAQYPDSAEVRREFAVALRALGRYEEALSQADAAVELKPTCSYAHSVRASILEALGDSDGAFDGHQETLRLILDNPKERGSQGETIARWTLTGRFRERGEISAAREEMERAIELQRDLVRRDCGSERLLKQLEDEYRQFPDAP
jgi:tetratricopeptide (TPR) repeat protein